MFTILSILILSSWLFFIFSYSIEDDILIFISGCFLLVTGIYVLVNGIENLNNWVTQALSVVQLGFGMLCLTAPYNMIQEW